MLDYKVTWCDGEEAASCGMFSDGYVITHIKVENESEMWKLACLLKRAALIKSASLKNIPSIKKELENLEYEDDEIKEMLERNNYDKDALDSINEDSIDSGWPWIMSITLDGKQIYDSGMDGIVEDADEDW